MRPTAISLFTGAGGLDLGLEEAGFEFLFCTDNDGDCIRTLLHNQRMQVNDGKGRPYLGSAHILEADIAQLTGTRIRALTGYESIDLLVGGPPCQPFSSAGKLKSFQDPRGSLYKHFVRLAAELRPRYILFENVRGLVTARAPGGKPGSALADILRDFQELEYRTRVALLNAADHGAFQRRVRLFILMALEAGPPDFPSPTHRGPKRKDDPDLFQQLDLPLWHTLGEFLAMQPAPCPEEVVQPSPALAAQLATLPSGRGVRSAGTREATRPGGHWGYKQGTFIADPSLPARTVTAASTQDWVRTGENGVLRRLTAKECQLLQCFPAEWTFVGNRASVFRQIGNAVPRIFGAQIGRILVSHWSDWRSRSFGPDGSSSAPLPWNVVESMRYTEREERRNGASRAAKASKGLGRAG